MKLMKDIILAILIIIHALALPNSARQSQEELASHRKFNSEIRDKA